MRVQISTGDVDREGKYTHICFAQRKGADRFIQKGKRTLLEISVEKSEKYTHRKFFLLARRIISSANQHRLSRIVVSLEDIQIFSGGKMSLESIVEHTIVNAEMANYQFVPYKEKPKEGWGKVEQLLLRVPESEKVSIEKVVKEAKIIAEGINFARDLSNTPGGHMTPKVLVSETKKVIRGTGIKLRVLDETEMKKIGMGGVLGVSQGSQAKPRFLILEYNGTRVKKDPIVLIGKGVTFDSGGIDIKPSPYGLEMKMDMSGAAVVIMSLITASRLGVKKRIIGLVPAVENMPSGESFRPGDILKSLSGKTIEVLNTDAEGRIILADALTYAERYKPGLVVDVATLTGAAEVAVGKRASIICSRDEALVNKFRKWGEMSGDYVWPLPLWDEYEADVQGTFGDVANMNAKGDWGEGGTITAAMFLYQFSKNFPRWLHIDMAPRMIASQNEFLSKGATGEPTRLLVQMLRSYTEK